MTRNCSLLIDLSAFSGVARSTWITLPKDERPLPSRRPTPTSRSQPSCGVAADRAAVMRLEALIARHVREFGWLPRLHLEPDATPYEISYAARRWFERPNRSPAQLRIRDLVGAPVGRVR